MKEPVELSDFLVSEKHFCRSLINSATKLWSQQREMWPLSVADWREGADKWKAGGREPIRLTVAIIVQILIFRRLFAWSTSFKEGCRNWCYSVGSKCQSRDSTNGLHCVIYGICQNETWTDFICHNFEKTFKRQKSVSSVLMGKTVRVLLVSNIQRICSVRRNFGFQSKSIIHKHTIQLWSSLTSSKYV